jgi:L-iditol 2-dehydrogenase
MLAAVRTGLGRIEALRVARPTPARGQALVRLERAAICGSDVHSLFDGLGFLTVPAGTIQPFGGTVNARGIARLLEEQRRPQSGIEMRGLPGRPGHEGVGVVVESLDPGLKPGDRVLALRAPCFAEFLVTRPNECVVLPAEPRLDRLLMAQQLGVAMFGLDMFWPREGRPARTATLIGTGPIGLSFLQLLKLRGVETVVVSDLLPERLELARSLGADVVVAAPHESVVEATFEATDGAGADLVIEAAGYDASRADAVRAVRQYGRVGFFGYPEGLAPASFPFADAFWKAPMTLTIAKGAQTVAGLQTFHEAVELIAEGVISVDHLLGVEYPLSQIQRAMEVARDREAIKVHVVPDGSATFAHAAAWAAMPPSSRPPT